MVGLEDSITAIEQIPVILDLDDLKYSIIGVFIFYAAINHYIFKLYDGENYLVLNNSPNTSLFSLNGQLIYACYEYIYSE
jgi:hypothetical protein